VYPEKKLKEDGDYFLTFDVRKQLECLLEDREINSALTKSFETVSRNPQVISEIQDGMLYKSQQLGTYDISCTYNTDGVRVFKSSSHSMWPFLLSINELPYQLRKYVTVLGALWFGYKKPTMKLFLTPIVRMRNQFQDDPLKWTTIDRRSVSSRIFFLVGSLDSPARFEIMQDAL